MNLAFSRKPRVVVCGTTFGKFYIEAFRAPDFPLELAGIFARGTRRSVDCAHHYGVPLYTVIDQFPNVDIACVVVRAGIVGGEGSELARTLMNRGIHVLQEHPLHHDELAECLRCAHANSVYYRVNSFYAHLKPIRRFIQMARRLKARQEILYFDATCGFQTAYSVFDVLSRISGTVRPHSLEAGAPQRLSGRPFVSVDGEVAGIPLTLRIQNQLNPRDPDNFAHVLHRITVGTASGNLILVNSQGPIVWNSRLHVSASARNHSGVVGAESEPLLSPSCILFETPADTFSWEGILADLWPDAAGSALIEFAGAVQAGRSALQDGQSELALCRIAQDLTRHIGPPELVENDAADLADTQEILAALAVSEDSSS